MADQYRSTEQYRSTDQYHDCDLCGERYVDRRYIRLVHNDNTNETLTVCVKHPLVEGQAELNADLAEQHK